MKALSLKLDDEIFQETEKIIKEVNLPRNTYINQAIKAFNKIKKRELLAEQLRRDSQLVRQSSRETMNDFDAITHEITE